ncbi:aldehyde ferredoxin oxidoreductase family protein [Candidatus Cloacimonas acidaminovorans]|jgi:aldehyde:ferredoxin oxidoreductase|uniref:Tungsten-containing aldehyde ferredoxin oxidoreductase, alpha chain n=1 Tax=Cloacimonas acidaminovorans (strain Evry) TaxID=459349 RepID=B0VEX1_CLOAI|nr:aldehyde ferredoxin oxidoreductase C-terminal domain-containing protein [Candidatus Cloacimonas acidaminovorans]CAO80592.1 Tungsten-containing aldehyde ferredoxin oxidoreductase, alpha chain [Candidatus Cloacimonas acidaminovorans str. Evry]HPV00368.1 aldehyde ferredoxin oxidoreductase C-terminal domain-containing protein [Candidatus Cloacimonas acidaminovorans]
MNRKLISEFKYDLAPVIRGYNKRSLYINLSTNEIKQKPVTELMIDKFVGGKGFDLYLMWHSVQDDTKWDSPENEICISFGPLCGNTSYPGSGKSIVTTISPLTGIPVDCNVGGHFGPYAKFSGWDAIELQGIANEEVIIYIDGDKGIVQILSAPDEEINSHILAEELIKEFADGPDKYQFVSVVSSGKAADNVLITCLNFSFWDKRRKVARLKQAGRGGTGSVFRHKKIKALVVKYSGLKVDSNNPEDAETLRMTGLKLHKEIEEGDATQNRMRQVGTAHLMEIMNDYDLLPIRNFKYGQSPEAEGLHSREFKNLFTQGMPDGCWYGCSLSCCKGVDNFEPRTGPYKGQKVCVDGPEYETAAGCGSNIGVFNARDVVEINFYCDTYGVDTISFGTSTAFAMECYENGILNKERTGGLELTWGNADAALELLHQMAKGEGFGVIVGQGVRRMKQIFAEKYGADPNFLQDIGMEAKGLEYSQYMSKESLAQQGGYTLALKGPQHDEAWLIFMDMVNNQIPTFKDKAEALHYFPMFRTWFGLQGLCKLPWNDIEPANNAETDEPAKVPEHVQNYVDIYKAITGKPLDKVSLIEQSERVYNFQKVFCLRMGKGRRIDDVPPYRAVGPVTEEEYLSRQERYDQQLKEKIGVDPEGKSTAEKMDILRKYREDQYQQLIDAVYERKGWTKEGVPKIEHLQKIGMDLPEVVEVVKRFL